jgi:hypothetical protein
MQMNNTRLKNAKRLKSLLQAQTQKPIEVEVPCITLNSFHQAPSAAKVEPEE